MKLSFVYATDDGYATLCGVSLFSLLRSHAESHACAEITIYILDNGISSEQRARFEATAEDFHCQLVFCDVSERLDTLGAKVNVYGNGGGYSAYARLFIQEFLPTSVERAVYLDCDTLVTGDLSSLFELPLNDCPIALGIDCLRQEYKQVIGLTMRDSYFNSGVMLIDLQAWRKGDWQTKVINTLESGRHYPLVDQDVLNLVLHGHIATLPPCFNFLSQFFLYLYEGYQKVYGFTDGIFPAHDAFASARKKSAIYHFCGQTFIRPWFRTSRHPMKTIYDTFYFSSRWKDIPQKAARFQFPYLIQYIFYRYAPARISVLLGTFMQRLFIWKTYRIWN